VLDLGCGAGTLTGLIRSSTQGQVIGIDPSEGMVLEARAKHQGIDIRFDIGTAEQLSFQQCFDVIVCNSTMQWFQDPASAVRNCYNALRPGGIMGVQAPATRDYCPNFLSAVEAVRKDPRTGPIFERFRDPWFFLESTPEYRQLFETAGFRVLFAEIDSVKTSHSPEDLFRVFSSEAIAGYLNPVYYDVDLSPDYLTDFITIVQQAFADQANSDGMVDLIFHRIYLVAMRSVEGIS